MNDTYIKHLQKIVQIPSVSSTDDLDTDWAPFEALHAFLKEAYPTIHERMALTPIGHASLLFHLKSNHPKAKPLLLMAHQDVVPPGNVSQWTYDPFSATIADGCLWGRGSNDCKSLLIAECETVEKLLKEGFEPDYDLYLFFGHNEEVQVKDEVCGPALAVKHLKEAGVRIGCLFDEGGCVKKGADYGTPVDTAEIGIAEKAPNETVLSKTGMGGHASQPGQGTVLGDIARAMAAVEAHPMPYRLTEASIAELKALAPFQSGERAAVFADPEGHFEELTAIAKQERAIDAILHTTFAVTMASGSPQSNVLPAHASCTMSVRVLQGDTSESMQAYLRNLMPDGVKVSVDIPEDPYPASSIECREYKLLEDVIHKVYGNDTALIPVIMTGATDSRYFSSICDHGFRFSGRYLTKEWGEAHQIDEKVPLDVVERAVNFFTVFLRAYGK